MKKLKSAKRDADPAPGGIVNIQELSRLKGPSVRQLRTLAAKGIISYYKFGWRSMMFSPERFDKDISAFEVQARNGRNGRPT
jgi:hypothetical protein